MTATVEVTEDGEWAISSVKEVIVDVEVVQLSEGTEGPMFDHGGHERDVGYPDGRISDCGLVNH